MEKHSKLHFRRGLAAVLACLLVIVSIPYNGLMTSRVRAGEGDEQTGFTIVVKDSEDNNILSDVKVTITANENESSVSKTCNSDVNGKAVFNSDDITAISSAAGDSGNITVAVENKAGYKDNTSAAVINVSRFTAGESLEVNMEPNFTGVSVVTTASKLTYTGSEQFLLGTDDVTYPSGDSTYIYNVEYSGDGSTYSSEIPKKTDSGIYSVYVKVKRTAVADSTDITEVIKLCKITIDKAEVTDFKLTGAVYAEDGQAAGNDVSNSLPDLSYGTKYLVKA